VHDVQSATAEGTKLLANFTGWEMLAVRNAFGTSTLLSFTYPQFVNSFKNNTENIGIISLDFQDVNKAY
jgi:hypothetical protein